MESEILRKPVSIRRRMLTGRFHVSLARREPNLRGCAAKMARYALKGNGKDNTYRIDTS